MTAWHASPHKFDKFSMDHIGTGEGAQAYGHGLYYAENPAVERQYLKSIPQSKVRRNFLDALPEDAEFDDVLAELGTGTFTDQQEAVIRALDADDWLGFDYPAQGINAAYTQIDNYDPSDELRAALNNTGYTYEVDIPDEHIDKMLDWDAPLSEQPAKIREALSADFEMPDFDVTQRVDELNKTRGLLAKDRLPSNQMREEKRWHELSAEVERLEAIKSAQGSGANIYQSLSRKMGGQEAASRYMGDLGIPGIKYYDGMSRGAGKGTRNFVVFDDSIVKTLSRNGEKIGDTLK
jgi:hypothetical protein